MRRFRFGLGAVGFGVVSIVAACGGGGGSAGPGQPDASPPGPDDGSTVDEAAAPPPTDATMPGSNDGSNDSGGSSDAPRESAVEAGNDASPADGGGEAGPDGASFVAPQPVSPYIVVDQFGYRTGAEKIAVIRNPQVGFDSLTHFTPGTTYAVVDAHSSVKLLEAAPTSWNGGATDTPSGDQAWWFDFSTVTTPGDYFVLDEQHNVRSNVFHVSDDVYRGVLAQAMRMLYYQRDGIAKMATYAGAAYADGVAHAQDETCGAYANGGTGDAGPTRDLRGGWYDAGDQSKYTNFVASDVIDLLRAYTENPGVFRDDYNIPESGNGVPDVLDEAKWALDWLARMQNADGSVLSIVVHAGGSPPSADTTPCVYGPASTSATLSTAAAFAEASIVFGASSAANTTYAGYAAQLLTMATNAWTWAVANPGITFSNYPALAGREQEVDSTGLQYKVAQAAAFLYESTGVATYQTAFQQKYGSLPAITTDPPQVEESESLLEYAKATASAPDADAQDLLSKFKSSTEAAETLVPTDPYLAYLPSYAQGSNGDKAGQGDLLYDLVAFNVEPAAGADASADASTASHQASLSAERYVHYLHGVNPLQLVYLSNMGEYGAENYATRFFSQWFAHGSRWDAVGVSMYGPPPGFITGGPNPGYTWEACCPSTCGGDFCGAAILSPPAGQPDEKSYKDFNDGWPLDSWKVTEPRDTYQTRYVRLLSKFTQ
ncbi:MAG TPA: glycoside hydrolase family 9 protein [Polyangiaceae bacterium]|jgi:endoglucanase|nr:glycoside hydrolase family 9 protein [Polyangiaceae bacterium]